jgi:hypothetical protein
MSRRFEDGSNGDGDSNGNGDNGNEGIKAAAAKGAGGRGQRFVATAPVAMASAANSGNGGGRQRWLYRRQREGGQQSTKKWQQRCSKLLDSGFATLSHITRVIWLSGKAAI